MLDADCYIDCLSSSFCVDNVIGLITFIGSTASYFNLLEKSLVLMLVPLF